MTAVQPVCVLIGALGGEGGGVLASWITQAAQAQGLPVQSTSIPGVAQRTGATTYYLEVYPRPGAALAGKQPVFALFPNPGTVDIVVASELLEAARAMERGFVTPDRTTLIGSTHRIYAVAEKSAPSDGRYDGAAAHAAASELCQRAVLSNFAKLAQDNHTSLNAVLLGAIAGTEILPIDDTGFEAAIRAFGKAQESNIRGFRLGAQAVRGPAPLAEAPLDDDKRSSPVRPAAGSLIADVSDKYPPAVMEIVPEAIARLVDFQDGRYARRYLQRLDRIVQAERDGHGEAFQYHLSRDVARQLAVWMSFEDVIRVADLKTRPDRLARVRQEVGVSDDQPLRLTEFLKPGVEEWCGLLPAFLGRPLFGMFVRRGWLERFNVNLRLRTSGVLGFTVLFLLARLRVWRRASMRFKDEQRAIDTWLDQLCTAIPLDYRLAMEIAALARLRKGYGETRRRGVDKFDRIVEVLVRPGLASGKAPQAAATAETMRTVRDAAMTDADDKAFDQLLGGLAATVAVASGPTQRAAE